MALDNKSPEYQTFIEAVKNGRAAEVEQHLTEHPEFLDLANDHEAMPLHWAAHNGRDSTAELLLNRGSTALDFPNKFGWTPLHFAAMNGRDSTVELILRHSGTSPVCIDSPDSDGVTPLHLAAVYGSDSTMTILKAAGAITLSLDELNQEQTAKLQAPIPEDKVLEIRYRIYFSRSLLAQLLF